ncbi:MAG TPA: AbfB domain-containing protein [Candidatus Limnocylindrales bacterium]|nr:AbfB domain-containing protein [Candidatus Limnocylindrales bacterium]
MRFRSLSAAVMVTLAAAVAVIAVPTPATAGPQLGASEPILPPGTDQPFSLRATSPGSTNRYVTTVRGFGVIAVITDSSTTAQKQAATFIARRGLATSECYSFESSTSPGQFLRHSRFRIRLDANDGSVLFAADATFCAVGGHTPRGLSWQSFNHPTRYLRHYNKELWIASNGGRLPSDNPINLANDTTWFTAAPRAP